MHNDKAVEGDHKKPQIILHYNATKSGVDNMDHLATLYTSRRKTNRWPLVHFTKFSGVIYDPSWQTTCREYVGRMRVKSVTCLQQCGVHCVFFAEPWVALLVVSVTLVCLSVRKENGSSHPHRTWYTHARLRSKGQGHAWLSNAGLLGFTSQWRMMCVCVWQHLVLDGYYSLSAPAHRSTICSPRSLLSR